MIKLSIIFRVSHYLITAFLLAAVLVLLHMLYILDMSKQKPYILSDEQKQHDVYLISYADGPNFFYMNRNILETSAVNRGFDFIYNYRREHIDPKYIAENPVLNDKRRGAGFWLWKPYIMLRTLKQVPEGAIVMYGDCGLIIRKPVREYLEKGLSTPGKDILLFHYDPKSNGYDGRVVSRDIFKAIGCDEERCRYGYHAWSGMVVVRNSPQSRAFIAQWLRYCENADLLRGENFKNANYPEFDCPQHDEAIISALGNRDKHMVNFVQMDAEFFSYVRMHRRKSEENSLIGYISSEYSRIESKLPNWWWAKLLTFKSSPL